MLSINQAVSAIIDALPTAAVITDRVLTIIHANEQAGLIFGEQVDEVVDRNLIEQMQSLGFEGDITRRDCVSPMEDAIAGQFCDLLDASSLHGVRIKSSEIQSAFEDGSTGYLFIIRRSYVDGSDKESVVDLDRMLTRGEMAAEIAHEMNNFLTILTGNTELIPMFIKNGDCQKAIDKLSVMKGTLGKIAGLSENLIEYGKMHSIQTISNLNEMLKSTLEFFEPQNRFDGIAVRTNLAEDLPPIRGDIGRIQQLVGNLIHNSADELKCVLCEDKTISITTQSVDDGSSVMIAVSDTGRGIDESIRDDIFLKRCSTKPTGEGYGLLACKQIADDHAATITFDTVLGEGTCFRVTIPAAVRPELESAELVDVPTVSKAT